MNDAPTPVPPAMAKPLDPRVTQLLNPGDIVLEDRPCMSCGYNLRGLNMRARCPECATDVLASLQTYLLAFAPTAFVHRVRLGLSVLLVSILAYAISLTFPLLAVLASLLTGPMLTPANAIGFQSWAAVLQFLPIVAMLSGYWMYTAADPTLSDFHKTQTPRILVRVAVIIIALAGVITTIGAFIVPKAMMNAAAAAQAAGAGAPAGGPAGPLPTPAPGVGGAGFSAILSLFQSMPVGWIAASSLAGLVQTIAWLVLFFASMRYSQLLAQRLPDESIAGQAKTFTWLIPVIYIVGSCIVVGPLVALALYLIVLWRLRSRLTLIAMMERAPLPS